MKIYNCHTHIFTIDHVPEDFLPYKLTHLLKNRWLKELLLPFLRHVDPFTDRDLLERLVNFIEISHNSTQKEIFNRLQGHYPTGTVFVILPMDKTYMGAGRVPVDLDTQHSDLAKLYKEHPDHIIPFAAVDPRRDGVLDMLKSLVERHSFRGIKLYPPLGFFPTDPRLDPVYAYAEERGLAVMTHCSRGGVYYQGKITEDMLTHPDTGEELERKKNDEFCDNFADPDNYVKVLEQYPNLRLCLAHFGGNGDWKSYLKDPWHPDTTAPKSWLSKILDLLKSGKYPNLYTDISYTLAHSRNWPILKIILLDEQVKHKVLFGSDFYMIERELHPERELSMAVRAYLGEELFGLIAEKNPEMYLGITS